MTSPTHPCRIREDGAVQAGGLTPFHIAPDLTLRIPDRYQARCRARGTPDVRVPLLQFLQELLDYLDEIDSPSS